MAEQLNLVEVSLQVIGSSSQVNEEMVQFWLTQDWFRGQDSVMVIFSWSCKVNVWNRGFVVELADALIDLSAQHVRPTT